MKKKIFLFLVLAACLVITPVSANEITNFYSDANDNVEFNENVEGDSALAGNIVDVIGNIDGIGFIAGNTVNIDGSLEYGFAAGNEVNIAGHVAKSLYLAGNTINFADNSSVGRDIKIVGQKINLAGKLERHVDVVGTKITMKSGTTVYGDVNLDANNIVIEDNVTIHGTLSYNENANATISDNTMITDIEKLATVEENNGIDANAVLSSIVNLVIVFLVISILLPQTIEKTSNLYKKPSFGLYVRNIGAGILILICIPLIAMLLLLSNIGIALGLILAALYVIALYLAYIYSGFLVGEILLIKVLKLKVNKYLSGIIGIIILKLLTLIPILGTIIGFLAITLGLTTLWLLIKQDKESKEGKEKITEAKIEEKKTEIKKEEKKQTPAKTTTTKKTTSTSSAKKTTTKPKTTTKKTTKETKK